MEDYSCPLCGEIIGVSIMGVNCQCGSCKHTYKVYPEPFSLSWESPKYTAEYLEFIKNYSENVCFKLGGMFGYCANHKSDIANKLRVMNKN